MLIELNRFLTTEEVRRDYRVPDALAGDILPVLPVVVVLPDGTRIHLESEVDRFLTEFVRRRCQQAAPGGEVGQPVPRLSATEEIILNGMALPESST